MTNGTVGQMDRGQRYNESARWLADMAKDLRSHAEQRPVDTVAVAALLQNIAEEHLRLAELREGLTWCESCGQPQESVDADNLCGECAGEAKRNQRSMSRN